MTTWRKAIEVARNVAFDESPIVACSLSEEGLDREFDDGFGGEEGEPFTMWTEDRVYFPLCYDGSEWVGSAPRNPCGEVMSHLGG